MQDKVHRLTCITSTGAFLIVRTSDTRQALDAAEAAIEGGIRAVEITYGVPGALDVIRRLSSKYATEDVLVGAGTVIDGHGARAAAEAGARLFVSPCPVPELIETANVFQAVSICGAFSPAEMFSAMRLGSDMVKLFPAEIVGPAYLRSVHAPFPHMPIAPTGAISPSNVGEWFRAGAVAVGVGGFVTKAGNRDDMTTATRQLLSAIQEARREPDA